MGNMGYCRFRNTLGDLKACKEHMDDALSGDEFKARQRLIELCKQIADDYESDNWTEESDSDDDD